jgi:hypothetical protein
VIVEILLPEQVQTVAAYTAQESIEHAGSEHAMQRIAPSARRSSVHSR